MKPSERIKEILETPDAYGFYTSETGAILDYLDEEWEKKQSKPEDKIVIDGIEYPVIYT